MAPLLLDLFRNMKEKLAVGSSQPPRVVVNSITEEDREAFDMFEAWMVEYNKSYDSNAETEKRFEIFKEAVREAERHNALNKSWTKGLNEFSDLTLQEFKRIYARSSVSPTDKQYALERYQLPIYYCI